MTPRRDGEALNKWLVVKKLLMNHLISSSQKKKHPPRSHKTLKTLKCRNLYLFGRFWNHLGSIEYQGSGNHSGIVWILRKVLKFSWESCSSSSFTVAMARACLGRSLNAEKVTIFSMIKQRCHGLFFEHFWDNQQNPMLRTCIYIYIPKGSKGRKFNGRCGKGDYLHKGYFSSSIIFVIFGTLFISPNGASRAASLKSSTLDTGLIQVYGT